MTDKEEVKMLRFGPMTGDGIANREVNPLTPTTGTRPGVIEVGLASFPATGVKMVAREVTPLAPTNGISTGAREIGTLVLAPAPGVVAATLEARPIAPITGAGTTVKDD